MGRAVYYKIVPKEVIEKRVKEIMEENNISDDLIFEVVESVMKENPNSGNLDNLIFEALEDWDL